MRLGNPSGLSDDNNDDISSKDIHEDNEDKSENERGVLRVDGDVLNF